MVDIVIIGGCGHVGLPLGMALARAGKRVVALDISEEAVAQARQPGFRVRSPFSLQASGRRPA